MFRRVLVANRGEIALRIINALRELGIESVVVFSEADRESLPVQFADLSVCIGPPPASESYLHIPRILSAAQITGAEAIHPGYGFLAENADFAELAEASGFAFIGPPASVIRKMGDKIEARRIMQEAGVPVIPGSDGPVEAVDQARAVAEQIGYPVILKAAAGGGGRGMRVVRDPRALETAFRSASREAELAFGDGRLYVEKYLRNPRHIEVQVLGDKYGNIIHLFERECTVQRRHQKLLEESPSPALSPEKRELLGEYALRGARAIGYQSAGTLEFLMDREGNLYFIEMNTRIQVEHPVTEWVTGVDLVKAQIRIAAGEPLPFRQEDIQMRGHAIEVRINAEDPARGFAPMPGKIEFLHLPGGPGVRVDTHVYQGYTVPPHYDSLIAKLIVYGQNRAEALAKLRRCIDEFTVVGIPTTLPFHRRVVEHPDFIAGNFDTGFVDRLLR